MIGRIFSAYVAEIIKYSRLFFPYFGPAFVMLAVFATLLIQPIAADGVSDLAFIGAAVRAALNIVGFLMLLIYAAGLVAGEMESGTVRTVLVRPLRRWEFLTAKLLNAMTYALVLNVVCVTTAWGIVALMGEASGIDFGGELMFTSQEMNLALLIAAALNLAPHFTAAAYAILISTLAQRTATAAGAAVGSWLIVDYLKHAFRFDEFMFSSYLEKSWMVYADRCEGLATPFLPEALYGLGGCAAWFIVFTGIAFAVIRRRNFGP